MVEANPGKQQEFQVILAQMKLVGDLLRCDMALSFQLRIITWADVETWVDMETVKTWTAVETGFSRFSSY